MGFAKRSPIVRRHTRWKVNHCRIPFQAEVGTSSSYGAAVYPVYQPTAPPKLFLYRPVVSPILFVPGRSGAERPGPRFPRIEHKRRSYEPTPFDRVTGRGSRRSPRSSAQEDCLHEKTLDARHSPGRLIPGEHNLQCSEIAQVVASLALSAQQVSQHGLTLVGKPCWLLFARTLLQKKTLTMSRR
jgi:hypothetical protein